MPSMPYLVSTIQNATQLCQSLGFITKTPKSWYLVSSVVIFLLIINIILIIVFHHKKIVCDLKKIKVGEESDELNKKTENFK